MHEFTKKSEAVLEKARAFAIKHRYTYIGTEHLLYGLIKEQTGIAGKILSKQKITAKYIVLPERAGILTQTLKEETSTI